MYIQHQRDIIASLTASGREIARAEKLLEHMEAVLEALRDHLKWLERNFSE